METRRIDPFRVLLAQQEQMKTDGLVYADNKMMHAIEKDNALKQVSNVACLPGIVGKSLAMPDIHLGYGFPIGGVAAFDYEKGVISPGGIGYDINCGVRLIRTNFSLKDIKQNLEKLLNVLFSEVPAGVGLEGKIRISENELRKVLRQGAKWAVSRGYGLAEDLEYIEDKGAFEWADDSVLSKRAIERGCPQVGTLGAGNHFLEIQEVTEIFDEKRASLWTA